MQAQIATENDNKTLIDYIKSFPIRGDVDLKIDRHENYFFTYEKTSDQYMTFVLKNEDNHIEATVTFVKKQCCYDISEQIVNLGFMKDLYVSPSKKAVLYFTNQFSELLETAKKNLNIDYFFTMLNGSSFKTLNNFIRPHQLKRPVPRYYHYRDVEIISLHGRFPFASKPVPTIKINKATSSDKEALINYILERNQYKSFRNIWNAISFDNYFEKMGDFAIQNFIIAKDAQDNIIGCLSLWSQQSVEDYIPIEYNLRGHNFRQFLKFMNLFGFAKTLPKPWINTQIEDFLCFKFANHIYTSNEDVFDSLLQFAFNTLEKNEFLVYPKIVGNIMHNPPKGWISAATPYAYYSILNVNQEIPDFLRPNNTNIPDIEVFSL